MSLSPRPVIRSAANATIRRLVRLRDNRRRRQAGRFLVDGWRETGRAVAAGLRPVCVYLDEAAVVDSAERRAVTAPADLIQPLSTSMLRQISYGEKTRGVVAEFSQPDWPLKDLRLGENPFVMVLDSIEKPGNLGAVFRSADAAGVSAVVLTGNSIDPFNPNAIRSSLGTIFTVPAAIASRSELEKFLSDNDFSVFATRPESPTSLWETTWSGPVAIVLGGEAAGLGEAWRGTEASPVSGFRIPMEGHADSLNLSITAAIVAFEAARRRLSVGGE